MKIPGILTPGFFLKFSRNMIKRWRHVLIGAAIAVFVFLVVLLMGQLIPKPPVAVIERARVKLSQAGTKKADTYSKKAYQEAKVLFDSAMANWSRQNKRFIYSRNYDKVEMYATQSAKKSDEAADNAVSNSANLKKTLEQKIDTLDKLVADLNKFFYDYPLSTEVRNRISKGKILLEEGRVTFKKGEYLQANKKVTDSEYLLTSCHDIATTNLKNYFNSYPTWRRWVNTTIKESENCGDYSIIIDKFSRKCFLYLNGVKKYEFDAELGTNWVGDKRVKGDKATPEGMYRITKKLDSGRTKYYKALLLNYPNDEDLKHFREEIDRGSLPPNAKIGGLIEIHGNGGKGIDWTEGCVALTDSEIDLVYRNVKVGTTVTIVGSMVDLQNAMKR
jgi:hypothetical protein